MPLLSNRYALLAKAEGTVGTDSVPTGAANSIQATNIRVSPLILEKVDRALLRPYLGSSEEIVVSEYAQVEFDVECAGAGTSATTAPKFGPLLVACGMAQTIGGSDVSYLPVSASFGTITIYAYVGDAVLHKLTGAMGTFTVDITAGGKATMKFRFIGNYVAVTDAASSGVAYTGWQTPVGVRDSSVPNFTLHSIAKTAIPYRSMTFDLGNDLKYRNLIGTTGAAITGRNATGQVVLEAAVVATKDWFATVRALTTSSLTASLNATATNIFEVTAPKVQLTDPAYGEEDNVVMMTMGMRLLPSSGNDELKIATK